MGVAIFALAIFAVFNVCGITGYPMHNSVDVADLINSHGYPVQNISVLTSDGYYLDIFRIPGDRSYKQQFEVAQQRNQHVKTNKPAVILVHGLLSNAEEFVLGGPSHSLAYILADHGFDVFLANTRGNNYARRHTTLNPERDAAFWRFCWDESGKRDLPAIIDKVLEVTGQEKVHFIGNNQGSTEFYVLASELPEYNNKIHKMVALGPVVFLEHSQHPLLRLIADHQDSSTWVIKNLGQNEFNPSSDIRPEVGVSQCISNGIDQKICENLFFLVNGYSQNLNTTTIKNVLEHLPDSASTRQILHYSQILKSGRFEPYLSKSQDQNDGEYDLGKVTVPVSLLYVPNDFLTQQEDVNTLVQKLPNVKNNIKYSQFSTNVDLLYGNNVNSVVYDAILNILNEH